MLEVYLTRMRCPHPLPPTLHCVGRKVFFFSFLFFSFLLLKGTKEQTKERTREGMREDEIV
jgi:hypothetical protein